MFLDQCQQGSDWPTAGHPQLAPYQIQGLDAVCTLINTRNPGVAHKLLKGPIPGVSGSTQDLQPEVGVIETLVGEERLNNWRH